MSMHLDELWEAIKRAAGPRVLCFFGIHDWNSRLTAIFHGDLDEEIESKWCANCKAERVLSHEFVPRWEAEERAKIRYEIKED